MTGLYGFTRVREQNIPELNTCATIFRHTKTGAEVLSLQNDDENKCFGIILRTPPADSTGVAHILEHAVFAGSRKYPLKDPLARLLKGSVKTFLNAFTYPDKTCYPVASQNLQDFYNLVDIYLDMVFYPLLRRETFEQHGWHYELERVDGELAYKGVVLNEMKGMFSSPDAAMIKVTQQALFPDITYGIESAGDPRAIPSLTYEQFIAFHRLYYHPSNARFFFYGNDDPGQRLRILDAYLADFDMLAIDSTIPLQPRFSQPGRVVRGHIGGQKGAGERTSMLNVAWLLDEQTNTQTTLALNILAYLLIGTSAGPLRKALIDSGLGEDITSGGLTDSLRQMVFVAGLKGIASDRAADVETLIIGTLERLARDGIDQQTIAAALNTIEFRLRENNTGNFPRGLSLLFWALTTWLYSYDPLAPLAFDAPLAAIKARLAAGERLFEDLLKRYFLDNSHRVTVLLRPESELGQSSAEAEREQLARARAAMCEADIQAIIANTQHLKQFHATPDPPELQAIIPRLEPADLGQYNKPIPLEVGQQHGARVLYHALATNGILYFDVGLDLHLLPQQQLPYISLFKRALLEFGTQREDFVQLSRRIGRTTGGIRAQTFTATICDSACGATWLFLRGKAVLARADDLLAIFHDILLTTRFDNQERVRQIVLEEKAVRETELISSGHIAINTRVRSRFDEADWAAEHMGGIGYLFFLRQLAQQIETDWPSVRATLEQIRATLINRNAIVCNVTVDTAGWRAFAPRLHAFLADLPAGPVRPAVWSLQAAGSAEGLIIPAQVNYVGKGANLYQLGYTPHGSASVITHYLGTTWLWERVRVQGGAYGGFCSFDHRSGMFSYLSYRDPNLLATLAVYDQTSTFLRQADPASTELTGSIVGAIGQLDAYQLPDAKGYFSMLRYLSGDTDARRQRMREEMLSTDLADFRAFAEVLDQVRDTGFVVVLGTQPAIEAAASARPGWLAVSKVL
jgi:Zn-dependent M16 (insulinase) family peptidase